MILVLKLLLAIYRFSYCNRLSVPIFLNVLNSNLNQELPPSSTLERMMERAITPRIRLIQNNIPMIAS